MAGNEKKIDFIHSLIPFFRLALRFTIASTNILRRTLIRDMSTRNDRTFSIVVAATLRGGIGCNGDLPWKRQLKSDLKHFEQVTSTVVDHAEQTVSRPKKNRPRVVTPS